jgi:disulfide bond formation protein DsbB
MQGQLADKRQCRHIQDMMIPRLRFALLICALASAGVVGLALASERYGGLVPCALCLVERWPYRLTAAMALVGLVLPRRGGWVMLVLCILMLLAAATAGFVHVGVEQHWWLSPLPECMAPNFTGMTIAERLAHMPARPSKACEDPTYLIPFLPVSMAAMNMLYALALSGGLTTFALRNRRSPP